MSNKKTVNDLILLLLPSVALILHAMWSIYNGRIVIKGATEYAYADSPFKFVLFVVFEIALSAFVIYQFLIKDNEERDKSDS